MGPTRGSSGTPAARGAPPTAVRGSPSGRRVLTGRGVPRGPPGTRGTSVRGMAPRGRGATPPVKSESEESVKDLTADDHREVVQQTKEEPTLCKISGIQSSSPEIIKEPLPLVVTPPKSILKKEIISPQKSDSNDENKASYLNEGYQDISPPESEKSNSEIDNADQNKSPNKGKGVSEMDKADQNKSLNEGNGVTNGNDDKEKPEVKEENEMETNDTEGKSRKRKSEGEKGFSPRKKRKSDHLVPKNPLMKLNELKPGLSYTIEKQEGPSHNPTFYVSVIVDGEKHVGKGRSKQDAKHSAALVALSSFVQFHDQSEVSQMMPQTFINKTDFTSDEMEEEDVSFNVSAMKNKMKYVDYPQVFMPKRSRIQKALAGFESKSPVMLLNELHPGSEYTLIDEMSGVPAHRFMMAVNVNNSLYEGSGQSKKQAKAAAARAALVSIYHIPLTGNYSSMNTGDSTTLTMSGLKQTVADKIASTVYETFSQIIVGFDDNKKWKVLSGIVMTTDEEMEKITVIGVSTGTKCISGEHISMNGAVLNDCHAEIISRRCFKDFLYSQLERYAEPDEDMNETLDDLIIVKNDNGGFSLKPEVKFHLFISTAPCGDARIFSPHELEFGDKVDKHPNRKGRGLLRTKIEAGEGTIPVKSSEALQTWDGIQGGQRLLTMSCSDKIARWNVLGIQGTLLSLYFQPIYLESIILGSMYHEDHMYRAIGKRIESAIGPLPDPYRLIIPKINIVTSTETRQASKSPTYSVNWSLGLANPEIVNGTTGKLHNGQLSRLSKRSFFSRFHKIRSKVPIIAGMDTKPTNVYAETKSTVVEYQIAKEMVFKAFQDAGLGTWVKKPPEQDDFDISF